MAEKKHLHPQQKHQKAHEKHGHLPKVGSPEQHEWDEHARDEVVSFGAWWAVAALAIITIIAVVLYFV